MQEKYSVKVIIRSTVETGEVFLEESILLIKADSFDDAYERAERYIEDNGICDAYRNVKGQLVTSEVVSYADCFLAYDDHEEVTEVYSSIKIPNEALTEKVIVAVEEMSATRKEMLPLREFFDPEHPDEFDD